MRSRTIISIIVVATLSIPFIAGCSSSSSAASQQEALKYDSVRQQHNAKKKAEGN